jgi:hypothetical protein
MNLRDEEANCGCPSERRILSGWSHLSILISAQIGLLDFSWGWLGSTIAQPTNPFVKTWSLQSSMPLNVGTGRTEQQADLQDTDAQYAGKPL